MRKDSSYAKRGVSAPFGRGAPDEDSGRIDDLVGEKFND